jgi:hypothetical protein
LSKKKIDNVEAAARGPDAMYWIDDNGRVFTRLSLGAIVECLPVADRLLRVGEIFSPPPAVLLPPTYVIKDVTGDEETRDHDEVSIADPKTTDEERAAWANYLERKAVYDGKVAEAERRKNAARGEFIALKGIRLVDSPDLEAWAEEQRERWGIGVDASAPGGLPLQYVSAEVIRTEDDGRRVTLGIFRASGLEKEALDTVESTFRREMGRP